MKQTTKRMYAIMAAVAVISGLTGAAAFSLMNRVVADGGRTPIEKSEEQQASFMRLANNDLPATHEYIDFTEAAEKACNAVVYIKETIGGGTRIQEYYVTFYY